MDSSARHHKAQAGLSAIVDAVLAEVEAAGADGIGNATVAAALGLETSVNGGQRNHLTHAILNRLVEEGRLQRRQAGKRIYYHKA